MLHHPYTRIQFPHSGRPPFVAINMVSSLDGKITSGGKLTPGSLGSPFDRKTMNVLRGHFDAVLTGGSTARQHPYYLGVPSHCEKLRKKRGLRAQPLSIILTRRGNLDPAAPLFTDPPRPPLIITSKQGARSLSPKIKGAANIETSAGGVQDFLKLLFTKYGVNTLLVEGGARTNYEFLQAGLVDQLFLTLAPRLVGSAFDLTMAMGERVLENKPRIILLSHFTRQNELFLRYKLNWEEQE